MTTRTGELVSAQVSKFGEISNLDTVNFEKDGFGFLIKNEDTTTVVLEVVPLNGDDYVSTNFEYGWNPELVKKIKSTATVVDLKWGV